MKKLVFLFFFAVPVFASAQITNIAVNDDSTLCINNLYAGALFGDYFDLAKVAQSYSGSVRVGAQLTYQASPFLSFRTFGVWERNGNEKDLVINSFSARIHLKRNFLELGNIASPATELRPLPPTAGGHFETFSEASIPGGGLGIKIGRNFSGGKNFSLGVVERAGKAEYSLKYGSRNFSATAYYNEGEKKFGGATVFSSKRVYNVSSFREDDLVANFFQWNLIPEKKIAFFMDAGYSFKKNEMIVIEHGFMKSFEGKLFSGLVAISFRQVPDQKSINGYLFIHI